MINVKASIPCIASLLIGLTFVPSIRGLSLECNFDSGAFCDWSMDIGDNVQWQTANSLTYDAWHSIPRTLTGTGLFAYANGQGGSSSVLTKRAILRSPLISGLDSPYVLSFDFWKTAIPPVLQVCTQAVGAQDVQCLDRIAGHSAQTWTKRDVTIPPQASSFQVLIIASDLLTKIDLIGLDNVQFGLNPVSRSQQLDGGINNNQIQYGRKWPGQPLAIAPNQILLPIPDRFRSNSNEANAEQANELAFTNTPQTAVTFRSVTETHIKPSVPLTSLTFRPPVDDTDNYSNNETLEERDDGATVTLQSPPTINLNQLGPIADLNDRNVPINILPILSSTQFQSIINQNSNRNQTQTPNKVSTNELTKTTKQRVSIQIAGPPSASPPASKKPMQDSHEPIKPNNRPRLIRIQPSDASALIQTIHLPHGPTSNGRKLRSSDEDENTQTTSTTTKRSTKKPITNPRDGIYVQWPGYTQLEFLQPISVEQQAQPTNQRAELQPQPQALRYQWKPTIQELQTKSLQKQQQQKQNKKKSYVDDLLLMWSQLWQ